MISFIYLSIFVHKISFRIIQTKILLLIMCSYLINISSNIYLFIIKSDISIFYVSYN